jgi:endonuclease-3
MLTVQRAVTALQDHYGKPSDPFPIDPWEQVIWENIAYLADDDARREAFEELRDTVGLSPEAIWHAPDKSLQSITARGILPALFARKLKRAARIALEEMGGELDAVVHGPIPAAKKALRRFPGIGEPGAEKILLMSGRAALLAPESNAIRVLVRLKLIPDRGAYARNYAAARELGAESFRGVKMMQRAHQLLRLHGRTLCLRTRPHCEECPLRLSCPSARKTAATR